MKLAKDVIKDMRKRGSVSIPEGYVTGESFEKWLRRKENPMEIEQSKEKEK